MFGVSTANGNVLFWRAAVWGHTSVNFERRLCCCVLKDWIRFSVFGHTDRYFLEIQKCTRFISHHPFVLWIWLHLGLFWRNSCRKLTFYRTQTYTHSLFFCPGLVEADVRMGGRDQSMCDRAKQTPQGHHVHKSITACDIELIDWCDHVITNIWN